MSSLEASDRVIQFALGWFAQPILLTGDYPAVMREKIDAKSEAQGYPQSRLPTFTADQQRLVANSSGLALINVNKHQQTFTSDFLGINFYTSEIVYPVDEGVEDVSYFKDDDADLYKDPTWFTSGSEWLMVTPWGLRSILSWIGSHYPGVDIYITENGVSDKVII